MKTAALSKSEWGGCIVLGSTPLLVSFLLKLTPDTLLDRFAKARLFDENMATTNALVSKFNEVNSYKVGGETAGKAEGYQRMKDEKATAEAGEPA